MEEWAGKRYICIITTSKKYSASTATQTLEYQIIMQARTRKPSLHCIGPSRGLLSLNDVCAYRSICLYFTPQTFTYQQLPVDDGTRAPVHAASTLILSLTHLLDLVVVCRPSLPNQQQLGMSTGAMPELQEAEAAADTSFCEPAISPTSISRLEEGSLRRNVSGRMRHKGPSKKPRLTKGTAYFHPATL